MATSIAPCRWRPCSEPQLKAARYDDVVDRRACRGNREASSTGVDIADLAAEAEPPPSPHVDPATVLQGTRVRVLLRRVWASIAAQLGLRVTRISPSDGAEG